MFSGDARLALLLFVAGLAGGAMNSVAGGGSFLTFPAMLLSGVPPVTANASSAVALWPGSVASALAYRDRLPRSWRVLGALGGASLAGGVAGAALLLGTPDATFSRLVPWLLLAAALLLTIGGRLGRHAATPGGEERAGRLAIGAALQLAIATYGGYFGGGMGILMLAAFTLRGMTDLHAMNGLKSVLAAAINGAAVIAFLIAGRVSAPETLVTLAGATLGGWLGARGARRLPQRRVRLLVLVVAWLMTAFFFLR